MTLKRLAILMAILIFLAGVGIAWLWHYAYTPEGRARIIIAQLKGDNDTTMRGWLLRHHLVRPGFTVSPTWECTPDFSAADEMAKLDPAVLPIVIEALRDENYEVRMMAIHSCGKFHSPLAIRPLVERLRETISRADGQGDGVESPIYFADSLIDIGPEAYGQLIEVTKKDPQVYQRLPQELSERKGTAAVPQLIAFLDGSGEPAQVQAAIELGKLKDKRATDALIRQLKDDNGDLRWHSIRSLGEIADPKAIPAILKIFKDEKIDDDFIRTLAAGALARMGRDDGLTFLLAQTKSPYPGSRVAAAEALDTNKIKGTLAPLLTLLGDSDAKVRREAVQAVGELRDPAALTRLMEILEEPGNDLHAEAAEALGRLKDKRATDALLRHLRDPAICYSLVRALGEIGDPKTIPAIRKLLKDPDPKVRELADYALDELGDKPPPASQPRKP